VDVTLALIRASEVDTQSRLANATAFDYIAARRSVLRPLPAMLAEPAILRIEPSLLRREEVDEGQADSLRGSGLYGNLDVDRELLLRGSADRHGR
jgi:hypothetical protein